MTIAFIFVGLPASGKSTFIKSILESNVYKQENVFVYSTDAFIEKTAAHFDLTYDEAFEGNIAAATKEMNEQVMAAIASNKTIVWDQTNMSAKKRRGILSRFSKNYRTLCVCIVPPRNQSEWDELYMRLASRPGKTIPPSIMNSMVNSYEEPSAAEGFDKISFYSITGEDLNVVKNTG